MERHVSKRETKVLGLPAKRCSSTTRCVAILARTLRGSRSRFVCRRRCPDGDGDDVDAKARVLFDDGGEQIKPRDAFDGLGIFLCDQGEEDEDEGEDGGNEAFMATLMTRGANG